MGIVMTSQFLCHFDAFVTLQQVYSEL